MDATISLISSPTKAQPVLSPGFVSRPVADRGAEPMDVFVASVPSPGGSAEAPSLEHFLATCSQTPVTLEGSGVATALTGAMCATPGAASPVLAAETAVSAAADRSAAAAGVTGSVLTAVGANSLLTSLAPALAGLTGLSAPAQAATPSNPVVWATAAGAALGGLLGSVPADGDMYSIDGSGALQGATSGGLLAGGLAGVVTGASFLGGVAIGLGALMAATIYLSREQPSGKNEVNLQPGINRFDGADEKAKFEQARNACERAWFETGGVLETRGRYEWTFGDKGADASFLDVLRAGIPSASADTFNTLVLLTRGLPAAGGDPAVVVVHGVQDVCRTQVTTDAIITPDGTQVPMSCIRGGVGFAQR